MVKPGHTKEGKSADRWHFRHPLWVRLAHWLNVLCLPILLMSGFQIFNAHPALYWGERSDRDRPILAMKAVRMESGEIRGVTTLFGHSFDTTGLFGASRNEGESSIAAGSRNGPPCPSTSGWRWGGAGTSSSPGFSS
ncbi:MAG: cytochrome b/b6 domain-containing protein [Candidatus Manganitrophus sp.]|nr:MAG: cytochrome b/b6 domain-containing protein [Candidatus Manganitrophus sp.]WDT81641.1 MAG: cytochrome b/b6 domain-containing protein [Candidatus Manganitrophus sp.]